ncbi:MAG TPA: fibronectin type III domain-containing protein [Gallionella sp.]|nr:fibronectin type III domain-containing protein [Gallionella sp.]
MSALARSKSISVAALSRTGLREWQRFLAINATVVIFAIMAFFMAFAVTGCGGGGGGTVAPPVTPTVAAPGAPTNFVATKTGEGVLSVSLSWSPPTTGGAPASYEVYRSTTTGTAFLPSNHVLSIPAVPVQTPYSIIDYDGLKSGTTYYYVVSAKNAGGETPSVEASATPTGGIVASFGNNFSAALIFADDIGIAGSGIPSTSVWTTNAASAVANTSTGLRPLSTQVLPVTAITLPYLDPATEFLKGGVTYYPQQSASTWQGEWRLAGASGVQAVNAAWGDNLVSQSLTSTSTIRIEMVLSEAIDPSVAMTSYAMTSLYGAQANEIQGTDGTSYLNVNPFVFASNARLTIQKMDGATNPVLLSQSLWTGDGPGFLAGEVSVAGNFTYGFVWNLKNQVLPTAIPTKTGTWRLTFSLDPDNSAAKAAAPTGTVVPLKTNNVSIATTTNGHILSPTEVYIDITVN